MSFFERIRRFFSGSPTNGAGPDGSPMISCEEALSFIQEFLDGELPSATRDQVKAHFDVCGQCYPRLRFEESFRTAVHRAARGEEASPALKARVLQLLADASGN